MEAVTHTASPDQQLRPPGAALSGMASRAAAVDIMNLTFSCPRCDQGARITLAPQAEALECPHCHQSISVPAGAIEGNEVRRCLVCPSTDLFVRKDFPQRLGVGIVTVGILASCVTWAMSEITATFAILFATALIDVVLYLIVPDALMCYRCGAMYRHTDQKGHEPFNLETHERYRQQAARMAGQSR
jgi:ribosomal protein S27AE